VHERGTVGDPGASLFNTIAREIFRNAGGSERFQFLGSPCAD